MCIRDSGNGDAESTAYFVSVLAGFGDLPVVRGVGRLHADADLVFFFQAEDGIRAPEMSRGLGDVYKRQLSP